MSDLRSKNLRIHSGFEITPDGWIETTIEEICSLGRGRVISQEEINRNPGPYPVFSSQTRNNGKMGSISTFDFSGAYVTWTTDGENAGTVFYREGKFNCTNVCGTILPKNPTQVDLKFLSYQLGSVAKRYVSYIGNPKLMNGVMATVGLIVPPIERQQKISRILQTIDQSIEKTEALIEKYQQIKAGLMHDLFTRGIGANGKLRPPRDQAPELYQETKIGWIPKKWKLHPLSRALFKIESGWSPACPEVPPGVGEWGVLKVSAVTKGYYDFRESKTLPDNLKPICSLEVKNGDVIMTRANGVAELVGKCVQVRNTQEKLMLSDKLLRLIPNIEFVTHDYLGFLMCSEQIKLQVDKSMNGSSGQRNISQSDIKTFLCTLPEKKEQIQISSTLLNHQKLIESEELCLAKLLLQKSGLMHDLLTGKVEVKAD